MLDEKGTVGGDFSKTDDAELIASVEYYIEGNYSEWQELTIPFEYKTSSKPEKLNIIIGAEDFFANRSNIGNGNQITVDDITLLYYSELSSAIYDGQEVEFNGTDAVLDKVYDENLLELYSNGHGAKIETEYDEDTGILVIYVMGEDYPGNSSNYNVYSIQFKKPEKPVQLGDVNKDNVITIADVTALVNVILGKDSENVYSRDAADVNGDKNITIADVTALVNLILGKTN